MNEEAGEPAGLSAKQRRALRQRQDPHGLHPFKRLFIGPSPVPSSSAAAVAAAIAEDVAISKPNAIAVAGQQGSVMVASQDRRSSQDSSSTQHLARAQGPDGAPERSQEPSRKRSNSFLRPLFPSSSPSQDRTISPRGSTARPELPSLTIPSGPSPDKRRALRDSSVASIDKRPRVVTRDASMASFASAKSKPYSSMSETEADDGTRQPRSHGRDDGTLTDRGTSSSPTKVRSSSPPFLSRPRGLSSDRRRASRSAVETGPIQAVRKKLSFDIAADAKSRRGRSEGDYQQSVHDGTLKQTLDLDMRSDEEEEVASPTSPISPSSKPNKGKAAMAASSSSKLRGAASHPTIGRTQSRSQDDASSSYTARTARGADGGIPRTGSFHSHRSSSLTRSQGRAYARNSVGAGGHKHVEEPDDDDEEEVNDAGGVPEASHDRRVSIAAQNNLGHKSRQSLDERRERSRQRSKMLGQGVPVGSTGALHGRSSSRIHGRDISRQSRMSRASTAGTLGSVGTRFTEGSFGASGGVRSRFFTFFGRRRDGPSEAKARDIQLDNIRHGRKLSAKGGVVAGAVGTSAGGTKWVGQTFEVGKRFWEVIESREEQLADEERAKGHHFGPNDVVTEEQDEDEDEEEENGEEDNLARIQHGRPRDRQMTKSPSDVLNTFARQAKQASRTDSEEVDDSDGHRPPTPALVPNESESDGSSPQRRTPGTPAPPNVVVERTSEDSKRPLSAGEEHKRKSLHHETSAASLLTVPHERGPDHESSFDIESRQGWSDVVSFMTANSSFKGSDRGRNDFGSLVEKSRRAFDHGLDGIRASRQSHSRKNTSDKKDGKISDLVTRVIREASGSISEEIRANRAGEPSVQTLGREPMSPREAAQHPEPPLGVEEKLPEEAYELLRRTSDPGCRPDADPSNDAASDTAVMMQKTESPVDASKGNTNFESPMEHEPIASAQPSNRAPLILEPKRAEGQSNVKSKERSVQFQDGDRLRIPLTGTGRSLSSSLFARNSPSSEPGPASVLLGGRLRGHTSSGDAAPAPPEEVLSRDHTPDESAHNSISKRSPSRELPQYAGEDEVVTRKSVLKKDRMLVKTAWSPSEDLPKDFNEREHRKYPLFMGDFREYLVVLRMGRLELWDDPSFTSRLLGHNDRLTLEMTVPLQKGKTFASIYSPVDRIFCITFAKDADHRGLLELRKSGTHVLLFDARSQSIGSDWMWELWRELGGTIPESLDVHIPIVDIRVRIPIPDEIPTGDEGEADGILALLPSSASQHGMEGEGYKMANRRNLLHVIRTLCHQIPQWDELARKIRDMGLRYELAWRNEISLHWIAHDRTTQGLSRDWAVLCGAIMPEYNKKPSVLEFRAAVHYPTQVRMPKGKVLTEPPSVEGFLWRVKAVSGALTRLYVTVHDGHIFFCRPTRAFPPDRHLACATEDNATALATAVPGQNQGMDRMEVGSSTHGQHRTYFHRHPRQGPHRRVTDVLMGRKKRVLREESLAALREQVMETVAAVASTQEEVDAQMEAYRAFEKRRQFEQINNADGYVDLRDILLVKSCGSGPIYRPGSDECEEERGTAPSSGTTTPLAKLSEVERADGAEPAQEPEDVGGEEGLAAAKDRLALRRERQFEVTMANHRSIRFEAYSRSVAREWLERLTALARYWKRREKTDALELMNASGYDPTLIKKRLQERSEPRPLGVSADAERISPMLGNIWNWCTIQGCRGIIRSGRLFHKKKAYQPFRSRYYILIAGRLLCYKLMTSNRTSRARQNSGIFHRRQETVVHLRDAYVYSGKLTEEMLLNGRSEGAGGFGASFGEGSGGAASATSRHLLPRVYADGLMSVDGDMDCTFVIRYRPQRVNQPADPQVVVSTGLDSATQAEASTVAPPSVERTTEAANPSALPTLGDKTYMNLVLRARSKLERDLWVHAISVEIERLVRDDREREDRLRNAGKTPYKAHQHYL